MHVNFFFWWKDNRDPLSPKSKLLVPLQICFIFLIYKYLHSLTLPLNQLWHFPGSLIKNKLNRIFICCSVTMSCLTLCNWRSNQLILKEISPEYSLEGLMLKLKFQYFGQLMQRADSLEKILILGKIEGRRRRGPERTRFLEDKSASLTPIHHKLMSIELVMPSNRLIPCGPLLLQPSILFSIRVFCNKTVLIRWPEYWSFSFSICPSNEYSGLISFRMDWSDLHEVHRTLKSLISLIV